MYNLEWGFHQLREVWTKDFKSSPTEEDDVEEDDVEMTGEVSGEVFRVDEDPFEKEMSLVNVETVLWLPCIWRRDRGSLFVRWKTG